MKKNLSLIIVAAILAITAIVLYLLNNDNSTLDITGEDFAVEDTAAVDKIFLADKYGSTALLERQGDGWTVNGKFTARQDAVNTLLATIKNLEVKSPVSKKARKTVIKQMASRSVKVEIYQGKRKPEKVYYVGHATQGNLGTHMLLEGSEQPMIMHIPGFFGYLTTRYFAEERKWRGTELFASSIDEIAHVKVEYKERAMQSFQINRSGNDWVLHSLHPEAKVENYDTTAVLRYLSNYKKVHFEAIEAYDEQKVDSILNTPVIFQITLTDRSGKETYVKAYRKKSPYMDQDDPDAKLQFDVDRMYANVNGKREIVLIQFFVFDHLLKDLSFFETDPSQGKANS